MFETHVFDADPIKWRLEFSGRSASIKPVVHLFSSPSPETKNTSPMSGYHPPSVPLCN